MFLENKLKVFFITISISFSGLIITYIADNFLHTAKHWIYLYFQPIGIGLTLFSIGLSILNIILILIDSTRKEWKKNFDVDLFKFIANHSFNYYLFLLMNIFRLEFQ